MRRCYIMSGIQQSFFSWIYSSEGSILLFLCRVQCSSHFVYSKITINCLTQARISSKFYTNKVVLIFYIGLFHPAKTRSCFFQAMSPVGRLTCVSYGHISVSQELHRDNEISIKPVSPVKRATFHMNSLSIKINLEHPRKIMMSVKYNRAGHMIYISFNPLKLRITLSSLFLLQGICVTFSL